MILRVSTNFVSKVLYKQQGTIFKLGQPSEVGSGKFRLILWQLNEV